MSTEITYEAAREELQKIVARLESGGEDLANTMKLWARGEELAQICQTFLDGARQTIEQARAARTPAPAPDNDQDS